MVSMHSAEDLQVAMIDVALFFCFLLSETDVFVHWPVGARTDGASDGIHCT
jgi:hypothetical protein